MKAVRAKIDNWTREIVLILPDEICGNLKTGDKIVLPWLLGSTSGYPRDIAFVLAEIA